MGQKQFSVEVSEAKKGETPIRRNIGAKDKLWNTPENIKEIDTVYALLQWAVKQYGKKDAMGWRNFVDIHEEEREVTKKIDGKDQKVKKNWQYFELSPYQYISYNQLNSIVSDLGAGFIHMGLKPSGEERLHIFAQTSTQWMQTALAASSQGIPCVTAYDTLGEEGLTHSLVQTESCAIFTDNEGLKTLPRPLEQAKHVRYIIHRDVIDDKDNNEDVQAILKSRPDMKLYSYNEVIAMGKENPIPANPSKPEDVAMIMYTSGSTGPPKGVVLLNKTVIAGIAGAVGNIKRNTMIGPTDRLIAFLPLAHIFEFTFELATFFWGGVLGYATVKTLSDTSVRNCKGDMKEFKPTIMVGVPAVWESVRKGVLGQVKDQSKLKQKAFWTAYNAKIGFAKYGISLPFVDAIFKKVRDATGGNLRLILNGGAPVSAETQQFISTLICPMLIGYGLTETNANTTLMTPDSWELGVCGEPTHAVNLKLVDVEDAGYFAKDNQGEVWVQGDPVSPYYFDNEKETKEAFTEDGWFKTGDIGEWLDNGCLRIIDRKKNLVKTLNGEYIALEKLESIYRSNGYVSNICVYADQTKVKPVAIIVAMENQIQSLCKELGVEYHEDAVHDKKVKNAIHKSLLQTGKEGGLKGVELLQGVAVSDKEWTPQNGFVTSAQKLQRKKILEDNKEEIDKIYEDS